MIANTIESAIQELKIRGSSREWRSWKDLAVSGQIIFCQVCKAIRFSRLVIADVTTLNFNLLFEIGYSVGLGIPVLPIRDTSYSRDKRAFEELGLLDTLGYLDYQNSTELTQMLIARGTP
jgi:nucleoside 2-deoxyribosyltransferase